MHNHRIENSYVHIFLCLFAFLHILLTLHAAHERLILAALSKAAGKLTANAEKYEFSSVENKKYQVRGILFCSYQTAYQVGIDRREEMSTKVARSHRKREAILLYDHDIIMSEPVSTAPCVVMTFTRVWYMLGILEKMDCYKLIPYCRTFVTHRKFPKPSFIQRETEEV